MGWWSATIMGGDSPLDARDTVLFDVLGIDVDKYFNEEYSTTDIRNLMVANLNEIVDYTFDEGWFEGVADQVLGVMVMEYGLPVEDAHVQTILERAKESAASDQWAANGNSERQQYIEQFVETLNTFDGSPTELPSEGLFDKIADHLASGKPGLTDKHT